MGNEESKGSFGAVVKGFLRRLKGADRDLGSGSGRERRAVLERALQAVLNHRPDHGWANVELPDEGGAMVQIARDSEDEFVFNVTPYPSSDDPRFLCQERGVQGLSRLTFGKWDAETFAEVRVRTEDLSVAADVLESIICRVSSQSGDPLVRAGYDGE